MDSALQYALMPFNAVAALVAAIVVFRVILRGGSRFWVNVYAFLISVYVFSVFGLATFGFIQQGELASYLRWTWTAVMVYFSLSYLTERRGKWRWTRR